MIKENHIEIAVFPNEVEAQLAQATLAAAEIDSFIQKDDAGGMMPMLEQSGGVRLYVDLNDADEAKTVLADISADFTDDDVDDDELEG